MPSQSKAQHNLMEMVRNNPAEAKRLGFNVPVKVAREFTTADKGRVRKLPARVSPKR